MSSNSNTASASASTKVSTPITPPTGVEVQVDDGPWETVNPKAKGKQDRESHVEKGSNSRNWRDRPREKAGESSKDGQGEKKASGSVGAGGTKGKKGSATASTSATRLNGDGGKSQPAAASTSRTTAPSIAPPSKPAWGLPASKTAPKSTPVSTDPVPTAKSTAKTNTGKTSTEPSSSNGTASTNGTTSINGTTASAPEHPAETSSAAGPSGAPVTKSNKETKEKSTPSQESKEKKQEPKAEISTPAPTPKVPAPPPTNPWNTRKPVLASPATITAPATESRSARIQFGQLSPSTEAANPLPNGHANGHAEEPVKIGGKKKKKESVPVVMDASQWPDVAQAQVVKTETKKETKVVEESVEEPQIGSKSMPTLRCRLC